MLPTFKICTASLLFAVALATGAHALGEDWPQYNGSNHDRSSGERLAHPDWSAAPPEPGWTVETPLGFSSFTVAEGKVYTLIQRADREVCVALNQGDGAEVWSRELGSAEFDGGGNSGAQGNKGGDGPRSTPAHDGGLLYVLDGNLKLYCLRAADGEPTWSVDLLEEHDGRNIHWQNAAAPLVEGDLVLVAGGGAGQTFLAFDKRSGEPRWKTGDEILTHATPIAATVHGVRQAIFFMRSGLVSLVPTTGEELWRIEYPFRTSSAASPVVHGDVVYCSAGYGVGAGAFRLHRDEEGWTSELLWRKRNDLMNHWSTPLCKDGYLYGMFSFKKYGEGPLMCVELETGEPRWSQEGYGPGNCILVGDDLVALTDAGEVVVVEATPEAYRELARAQLLEGKCWSSPTFSDGKLYVRSTVEGVMLDLGGNPKR